MAPRGLLAHAAAFLLCHLLAACVLSLAVVGWLYRDAIFGLGAGPEVVQGVPTAVPAAPFQVAPVALREPASTVPFEPARPVSQEPPPLVFRPLEPVVPLQATEPVAASPPAAVPDVAAPPGPSTPPTQRPPEPRPPQPQRVPVSGVSLGSPQEWPERPLPETAPVPASPHPAAIPEPAVRETLLNEARTASRTADFATAERRYRELVERVPDDPEPAGELADIYRRQGRDEDAAAAYVEAARRLVHNGQTARARALAGRLQVWSPQTANRILALLPQAAQPGGYSPAPPSLYRSLGR